MIGIDSGEIGKQDAETGSQFGVNRQKFAAIGKILPQLASTLWISAKCMLKSPFILRKSAKICRHWQNFASIGIHFVEAGKVHVEIAIYFAETGKKLPRSASILGKSANRMRKWSLQT